MPKQPYWTSLVLCTGALSTCLAWPSDLAAVLQSSSPCAALHYVLDDEVSFPQSVAYNSSLSSYFSQQEQELAPACIVSPQNREDVQKTIKALGLLNRASQSLDKGPVQFAIRGGGHTSNAGAANINGGVTVDMGAMNQVSFNEEQTVTSVGAGARWIDVYSKLDPMKLAIPGGRVADVGVAGLTTGGGLSFFAPRYGFVCDSVLNFEIVLASNLVINANATSHPALFTALKGGSNNFGIVTKFSFRTFPQPALWGGIIVYPISTKDAQLAAFQTFVTAPNYDPFATMITSFGYSSAVQSVAVVNSICYTKAEPDPTVLRPFTSIQPQYSNTMRLTNLSNRTIEQGAFSPNGLREIYTSITVRPSLPLLQLTYSHWNTSLSPLLHVPNLIYSLTLQPLPAPLLAAQSPNALGLSPKTGPLLIVQVSVSWSSPASDGVIESALRGFFTAVDASAKTMGLAERFVYLNYAATWQDVIGGYGEASGEQLRETSRRYDPEGLFQSEVPGGFKLFGGPGRGG